MGSTGLLLIFALVNAANARLASQTGSRRWISVLGAILCIAALANLIRYTSRHTPSHIWVLAAMLVLAFVVEGIYRLWRKGHLSV